MFDDVDEIRARVAAQVVEAQERAAQARDLRIKVEAVRGRVRSPQHELEVEVDSSGRLCALELSDAALGLGAERLGRLILTTATEAHKRAAAQVGELAVETFGEDSPAAARIRAESEARFGGPADDTAHDTGEDAREAGARERRGGEPDRFGISW